MRLIKDAKSVALKAHSMWAFYLSIPAAWGADVVYLLTGRDTNPTLWLLTSTACVVYGVIGRLKHQGIGE